MLVHKVGDLFDSKQPALGHGVNTHGVMGSGIAPIFKRKFPEIWHPYHTVCNTGMLKPGSVLPVLAQGTWILNMASQDAPGANASLKWLEESLEASLSWMRSEGVTGLAIPRIGAGIGGLQWDDVLDLLERKADEYADITLEVWSLPGA